MSVTRGSVQYVADFQLANAAPDDGGSRAQAQTDESWGPGTGSRQYDRQVEFSFTLAGAGTQLIDFQDILQASGVALTLLEVRHFSIKSLDANPSAGVSIEPDASDGWTAIIAAVGDKLTLKPGAGFEFTSPIDGGYAVAADNKELLLTNLDGAVAATVTGVIVGCSA